MLSTVPTRPTVVRSSGEFDERESGHLLGSTGGCFERVDRAWAGADDGHGAWGQGSISAAPPLPRGRSAATPRLSPSSPRLKLIRTGAPLASARPVRTTASPARALAPASASRRAPAAAPARRTSLAARASAVIVPVKTTGTKEKVKIGINGMRGGGWGVGARVRLERAGRCLERERKRAQAKRARPPPSPRDEHP